jgi:hypothetical protein
VPHVVSTWLLINLCTKDQLEFARSGYDIRLRSLRTEVNIPKGVVSRKYRKYIAPICCLIVLVSGLHTPHADAQGGMGRMLGMGRGGGGGGKNKQQQATSSSGPEERVNPFAPDADPVEGVEARTTAMEQFIFGRADIKLKIEARLQKLEKKLIPYEHHAEGQPLSKRVDRLWSTLEAANKRAERQ